MFSFFLIDLISFVCQVNGHNVATNLSKTVGDVFLLYFHTFREKERIYVLVCIAKPGWALLPGQQETNTMRMEEALIAPSRRGAGSSCSGEPGFVVSLKVLRP